jgi:hypothetical protein
MRTLASKLRLPAGPAAAVINPPEGYAEQLGSFSSIGSGYVPVAQVAIDDYWTALRFRRGA